MILVIHKNYHECKCRNVFTFQNDFVPSQSSTTLTPGHHGPCSLLKTLPPGGDQRAPPPWLGPSARHHRPRHRQPGGALPDHSPGPAGGGHATSGFGARARPGGRRQEGGAVASGQGAGQGAGGQGAALADGPGDHLHLGAGGREDGGAQSAQSGGPGGRSRR